MLLLHSIYPSILTWRDIVVTPIVILLIILHSEKTRKKYLSSPLKKYFRPALYLRFVGCFLSAAMYQFYYNFGDTFGYYQGVVSINNAFWSDFGLFLEIIFSTPGEYSYEAFNYFRETRTTWYVNGESTMIVIKLGGLLSLITFKSYLSIGMILSYFSFRGCWRLFETFTNYYPNIHKRIAIAVLFIPSVFFWGAAGLMKDTLAMASIGYLTYYSNQLLIKRKRVFKSLLVLPIAIYLSLVKVYLLAAFIPSLIIWVFLHLRKNVKSSLIRVSLTPIFVLFILGFGVISYSFISQFSARLSGGDLKSVLSIAKGVQMDFLRHEGSTYDLGDWDPSITGVLKIAPSAINVSLFRPYLWEVKKVIYLPSAIESLATLILTLYIIIKSGVFRFFKEIFTDPNITFCFIFSIFFAFVVGFTSFNFGALARYKIPMLPFYFTMLFVLIEKRERSRKSFV